MGCYIIIYNILLSFIIYTTNFAVDICGCSVLWNSSNIIDESIVSILKRLSIYFTSLDEAVPQCELPKIGTGSWGPNGDEVFNELSMFFELLKSEESLDSYIKRFKGLVSLNSAWGSSYCFLCVQKTLAF